MRSSNTPTRFRALQMPLSPAHAQDTDPIKALADSLREKKGVQWGTAKLETPDGEGTYVEYFRGKDFARYFRANPEKLNIHVPAKPGKHAGILAGHTLGGRVLRDHVKPCLVAPPQARLLMTRSRSL